LRLKGFNCFCLDCKPALIVRIQETRLLTVKLLHDSAPACQGVPPRNLLARAYRFAEDIEPRHARTIALNLGGSPDLILQAGYRVVSGTFVAAIRRQNFELPDFVTVRKTLLIPCLNEQGEIVALHDQNGQWLFGSESHVANPKRAGIVPVRICRTTAEADTLALGENVCAVVAHGQPILDLLSRLNGEKARVAA
jgi:hypothetical protein